MSTRRRYYTVEEAAELIFNSWSDSEDGFDEDGEEEDDIYEEVVVETITENLHEDMELEVEHEIVSNDVNEAFDIANMEIVFAESVPEFSNTATALNELKQLKDKCSRIVWKKKDFEISSEQHKFLGTSDLTEDQINLSTPLSFFNYFFDDSIVAKIVEETNLYGFQKNPNNTKSFTTKDVKNFIGICLFTSVAQITNTRRYWHPKLGNVMVQETMPLRKFEAIRQNIHFNNNERMLPRTHPDHDRLYKIRPLLNELIQNFQKVPLEECVSVDEQMCSTKTRSFLKQYMPAKPHKWGFKLFVLCGISGFAYNLELYTGQENDHEKRPRSELNLGAASNVVIRLARIIPSNTNYKLFFDNYYSSIPLLTELVKRKIYCLGTARKNRIPNSKLPDDSYWKTQQRGSSFEMVSNIEGNQITVVQWKDTKIVTLISTFVGRIPLHLSTRWEKSSGTINVECPSIVKEYNKFMGGVDLLDANLGRHKIKIRSKKWYMRVFYHMLDLTVANAWILYKRVEKQRGTPEKKLLSLADFKAEISETLMKYADPIRVGRPSRDIMDRIDLKRKKASVAQLPPKEIRLDNIGHLPTWNGSRLSCKLPGCNKLGFVNCTKCNVSLCLNKERNCYAIFHS